MATVLFWLYLINAFIVEGQVESGFRILGGHVTAPGAAPYHVAVITEFDRLGVQICGGTILSTRWVLTARHCVGPVWSDFSSPRAISTFVKAGARRLFTDGDLYESDKVALHGNRRPCPHDMALVRTTRALVYSATVRPAALPRGDLGVGVQGVLNGWGSTELGGNMSDSLQYIRMTTMDLKECARHVLVSYNHVCMQPVVGEGACKGDSGGGLVVDGEVAAVVSYVVAVENRCGRGEPDIFTRVFPYIPWIKSVMETL